MSPTRLEPLSPTMGVFVSDTHRFNTDTILLAHFASPKKGERCADLGTGCGTIPLIWLTRYQPEQICAVEIQPDAVELATRSAQHFGVTEKMRVLNMDLCSINQPGSCDPWLEKLDLVSCNPPYKAPGTGIQNPGDGKRLARHEEACTMEDIARAAARILRHGGRFCLCQRPERLTDILITLNRNGLEAKRLRFVQSRTDKAPKLFLLQARKGGQPGGLVVDPSLIISNHDGSFTDEMLSIYGEYQEGHL